MKVESGDGVDLYKDKYIIVEIIPTTSKKETGFIAQISALKLEGIKLLDRFDYRVKEEDIDNIDIKNMISYDKEVFTYVKKEESILDLFQKFSENLPLLLLNDTYTLDYLQDLENQKEIIFPYLHLENQENVFDTIKEKYLLEPSNHLVDLLYEAIILEKNRSEKE